MGFLFGRDRKPAARSPEVPAPDDALRQVLEETLSDRYTLERELGRGGMATVYLAHEVGQGQAVAIKAMHRELSCALGVERFRREMGIAASLSHPCIVPLSDSGTAGDVLYYIMPYIEGESLFQRLKREKRLSLDDALHITDEMAAALGYAHSRGVLHRDVKPENILLAKGHALLADFGLARAIGAADHRKLTQTGTIVGTVYYACPEQLREERDLDQRVDIYSLGCILYEMLTGRPPYTGLSLTDLVTRILRDPIPSVRKVNPAVPPAVDQAIGRALAKSAAERFATMDEFAAALPGRGTKPTPAA
jgi:eukaryotic-like serine/threonine-protein kinase